jgi:hypothetical protein
MRKTLMALTATSALLMSGAAFAQAQAGDGSGGIWAVQKNSKAQAKAKDKAAADQAPASAAPAAAKADDKGAAAGASAGAGGAVAGGALAGLATGQSVKSSGGAALGKVSKIVKASDGSVSQVIVTSSTGRSFPVAASKLSISGGVVTASDSSDQ